jgi:hypothetical protein
LLLGCPQRFQNLARPARTELHLLQAGALGLKLGLVEGSRFGSSAAVAALR